MKSLNEMEVKSVEELVVEERKEEGIALWRKSTVKIPLISQCTALLQVEVTHAPLQQSPRR